MTLSGAQSCRWCCLEGSNRETTTNLERCDPLLGQAVGGVIADLAGGDGALPCCGWQLADGHILATLQTAGKGRFKRIEVKNQA